MVIVAGKEGIRRLKCNGNNASEKNFLNSGKKLKNEKRSLSGIILHGSIKNSV